MHRHTSHVSMVAVHDCGFELLSQPSYFADLAPSDFLPTVQIFKGHGFADDEAVIMAINEWIKGHGRNFFCKDGICVLISEGMRLVIVSDPSLT